MQRREFLLHLAAAPLCARATGAAVKDTAFHPPWLGGSNRSPLALSPRNFGEFFDRPVLVVTPRYAAEPDIVRVMSTASCSFVPQSPPDAAHAPGSLVTILGNDLAPQTSFATSVPWASAQHGVVVLINGRRAPWQYLSPAQINIQVPFETSPGVWELTVCNPAGRTSVPIRIAAHAPWAFGCGPHLASALRTRDLGHAQLTPWVGFCTPARPGEVITLLFTGAGCGSMRIPAGDYNPGNLLAVGERCVIKRPTIRLFQNTSQGVNATSARVLFAAKVPDLIGVDHVDFVLPATLRTGVYTLEVRIDGVGAAAVDLPVSCTQEALDAWICAHRWRAILPAQP